jgi:hypothetical protein
VIDDGAIEGADPPSFRFDGLDVVHHVDSKRLGGARVVEPPHARMAARRHELRFLEAELAQVVTDEDGHLLYATVLRAD